MYYNRKIQTIIFEKSIDKMNKIGYNISEDGSMTVHRRDEAYSRFSFGYMWSVAIWAWYCRRLNRGVSPKESTESHT